MTLSVGFRRRESTGRFPLPAVFRGSILHPLSQQGSRVITISRKTVVEQGWGKGELVAAGQGTSATGMEMDIREQWLIDLDTHALRVAKVTSTLGSTFTRQFVLERVAER